MPKSGTRTPDAPTKRVLEPSSWSRDLTPRLGELVRRLESPPRRELVRHDLLHRRLAMPPNLRGLREFQGDGVHWLREHDRGVLGDEMGLGKSAQVLRALSIGARAILICPAGLRLMWRDQVAEWRPDLAARIARHGRGDELLPAPGEIVIGNYEALEEPVSKRVLIWGRNLGDVTAIFDEAHYLKNVEAQRTIRARALVRQVAVAWALTGTPILGSPEDLWGLFETMQLIRKSFGTRRAFLEAFGAKRKRGGYEWTATDYSIAREAIAPVMLRRRAEDVLPELPRVRFETIPVELAASASLDDAERAWQLRGATTLPPFEELASAMAELARAKIPAMLEQVKLHEDEGLPLLVFAAHVDPIQALERREGWATITGDTKERDVHDAVARFQRGDLRGLGLTILKGGVGHTLTRAGHGLLVSLAYTPAWNDQAVRRTIRFGQMAKFVLFRRLIADNPLDRRLFEILGTKEALIEGVLG